MVLHRGISNMSKEQGTPKVKKNCKQISNVESHCWNKQVKHAIQYKYKYLVNLEQDKYFFLMEIKWVTDESWRTNLFKKINKIKSLKSSVQ